MADDDQASERRDPDQGTRTVVIEHEGRAWGAYCPDLPGLGAAGDSRAEVEQLICEALPLHLEALREEGEPIPEPTTQAALIED